MSSLNIRDFPEALLLKAKVAAVKRNLTLRDFAILAISREVNGQKQTPPVVREGVK